MSAPMPEEPEVSRLSMWFLRGAFVVATLIVLFFLGQAVVSLLDDDGGDDATIADLLATTTTTEAAAAETDAIGEADDGGDSATETDTESEGSDGDADAPAAGPTAAEQAELDAFVDEAIAFIENARQREFLERPVVELVDVDTMTQIVLDDIENDLASDPEGAAESLAFARSIGFFAADQDFLDVYEIFVSGGVLGVYFPTSDRLLVRSDGELSLSAKATVVHELVHAFDDQHFNLDRPELGADGDAAWAFTAAVEGSASYVEDLWRATLSEEESAALTAEELAIDVGDIFSLDFGFLIYQTSVYDYGQTWLLRRLPGEGIAAIDDALINGAPSSEVVIEPLDADALVPVDVSFPAVDGEIVWQGTGGQALIGAITFLSDADGSVSSGWGGDAITVYLDGDGRECLRWDIDTDSAADRAELLDGLQNWAEQAGADISETGGLVRVDRCAG